MYRFAVVGCAIVVVGLALNKLWDLLFWWWNFHLLDLQLMDLHQMSCGICSYLPNLWLILRRMIVVEHAGIKISYWVSSSKSLVDEKRFRQNGPASQHIREEPTKNKFLVNFCFEWTTWNPFSSDLFLSPQSLVEKRRMKVVEHVEICSCGICNCSWWTCIEQVVGFTVLVLEFHLLDLQMMDFIQTSCGIWPYLPHLWLIVRRMIVVEHARIKSPTEFHHPSLWLIKEGFSRMVLPVNTSGRNQLKTSF